MIPIRDENPRGFIPFVNYIFIAVNIAVFFLQPQTEKELNLFFKLHGAIPALLSDPHSLLMNNNFSAFMALFTSLFIHGDLLHLLSNMLYLWIFGDNIEYAVGHFRYFLFYLLCGILATTVQIIINPLSDLPIIGASGAISGIMGAYLLLFPRNRVSMLFFFIFIIRIFKVPALALLSIWFLIQLGQGYFSIGQQDAGGVAWFAHIGGFLSGLILVSLFKKRSKLKYNNRLQPKTK